MRLRNRPSGTSGEETRAWIARKARNSTSAAPSRPSVCGEVHPFSLPFTIAYTASINDAVIVIAPAKSTRPVAPGPFPVGSRRSERMYTATPIGMLTRKIQCQLSASVSTPPASTPITPPAESTKPNRPIAFARSACSVKRVIRSESATAATIAPPTPCAARAINRNSCEFATPQASEAAVKSAIPIRNSRRCPKRSPSRPPSSRKPPNVSRYAFTTHASDVCEKPRSSRIDGRATFTIVPSSTIIRSPRQST